MAAIDKLLELVQQEAYYKGGGGDEPQTAKLDRIFGSVRNITDTQRNIIKERLAAKKAELEAKKAGLEQKKLERETTPVFSLYDIGGRPRETPAETNAALNRIFQGTDAETPDERIGRLGEQIEAKRSQLSAEQKPVFTPDEFKDVASAKALLGTTTLYLNRDNGSVGIEPTANSIPIAKVSEKQAAAIMSGKERANIVARGAEKRQEKSQSFQEGKEIRSEERAASKEEHKMTADQEKTVKNLQQLNS